MESRPEYGKSVFSEKNVVLVIVIAESEGAHQNRRHKYWVECLKVHLEVILKVIILKAGLRKEPSRACPLSTSLESPFNFSGAFTSTTSPKAYYSVSAETTERI